jgi:hypothetical protein
MDDLKDQLAAVKEQLEQASDAPASPSNTNYPQRDGCVPRQLDHLWQRRVVAGNLMAPMTGRNLNKKYRLCGAATRMDLNDELQCIAVQEEQRNDYRRKRKKRGLMKIPDFSVRYR